MKIYSLFFVITISLGSFLLFQVQPIISKYILPWFGGTSAVWITAMLFFQVMLLLGYAYVFFLRRFSLQKQVLIHLLFLFSVASLVLVLFAHWQTPILPPHEWKLSDNLPPTLQVLGILFVGVGLPYFLLSTTSIVLQKWFSNTREGESPYLFYAFSNAASLFGVLSYPLLVEPFVSLKIQGIWWAIGFLIYSTFLFICCFFIIHSLKQKKQKKKEVHAMVSYSSVTKEKFVLWFMLSFTSTLLLLSITNILTQAIAPVPFLWLLPLSLYLGSFILCFSSERWYARTFWAYLFLVTLPWALLFLLIGAPTTVIGASVYGLILFSCCMLCHGELYHYRPHPKSLDLFYVVIAFGGATSGVFVGVVAPLLFNWVWEIYIAFYLSFLIAVGVVIHYKKSLVYQWSRACFGSQKEAYLFAAIGFPIILIATSCVLFVMKDVDSIQTWRSFYSVLTVEKKTVDTGKIAYLKHGNIIHGAQYQEEKLRDKPTTYYTKDSGIARIYKYYPRPKEGLHVGVIGLGVGTLAIYGKAEDTYRFYEIDPQVVEIAQTEFTYLKDTQAQTEIVIGDGRLSLEKELSDNSKPFDLLIFDAFSGDSIPVHLLTKEAFALYLKRLSSDGVLVIHISNSYLDLKKPLVTLADYYNLEYAFLYTPAQGEAFATEWAVFTYDKKLLTNPGITELKEKNPSAGAVGLWTDDYSNLFQILK